MNNIKITMWLDTSKEVELEKENGYIVTMPFISKRLKDETLDNGYFEFISESKETIKPFTKCKVELGNEVYYYYAESRVRRISMSLDKYKHSVSLIEPTKILERHIIGTRFFSKDSTFFNTNEGLINLMLETCYPTFEALGGFLYESKISKITLNTNGREEFLNEPFEQELAQQETLFEALEKVGKTMNAFPRMTDFETLTFDFFNIGEEETFEIENDFNEEINIDMEDYSQSLDSAVSNGIDEDKKHIFPDDNADPNFLVNTGFGLNPIRSSVFPRTEEYRITEDDAEIILEQPIRRIKKVLVFPRQIATTPGDYFNASPPPIDITKYIFPQEEYDLLKEDGEDFGNKVCAGSFEIGGNKISNLLFSIKKFWFISSETAIVNIVADKLVEGGNPGYPDFDEGTKLDGASIKTFTNFRFKIEYEPFINTKIKRYKNFWEYEEGEEKRNSLIYNQQAETIDLNFYGQNLKATIEKMGNEEIVISFITRKTDKIDLNKKINGMFINEINEEWENEHRKISISLIKEYNKIAADVGVKSDLRLFDIPKNKVVDRNLNLQFFIGVGKTRENHVPLLLGGSTPFNKSFGRVLTNDPNTSYETNFRSFFIRFRATNIPSSLRVFTPLIVYQENSVTLNFEAEDNTVIGSYANRLPGPFSSTTYRKEFGTYTNDVGETTNISLLGVTDREIVREDEPFEYPFLLGASANPIPSNKTLFDIGVNVKKDAREKLKVQMQFNVLSEHRDLIITKEFIEHIGFSADKFKTPLRRVVFFNGKKTDRFKKADLINETFYVINDGVASEGFSILFNELTNVFDIVIDQQLKDQYDGFAITDNVGKVIFISNDINIENIYLNFLEDLD